MTWQAAAFTGALLVNTGIFLAGVQTMRHDVNGIGKKQRRMLAEMLRQAANDPESVKRIAGLLE